MRQLLFLFMIIALCFGCTQKKEPQDKLTQEVPQVAKPLAVAPAEPMIVQKEPLGAEYPAQPIIQPATIPGEQQPLSVEPKKGGEALINEQRWGFSVYNPAQGITRYFTNKGDFLGERKQ
ncbi:MAG: hypothetical protein KBA46_02950 [Candidatus Omnitrophica bacterium]|nr:hypothetical protein [Candidatus Omnitrophota bacterium]